jgi:hypothetical protein
MIFCARGTRGLRRVGGAAWSSSCSRNAHDKNVLVRRAQSRINQTALESAVRDCGDDTGSGNSIRPYSWRDDEQAWKEHLRSRL